LAPWVALPLALAAMGAVADESAEAPKPLTKEQLAERLNGVTASDITEAPIPGLYQVAVGSNVAYVTDDAKFVFRGDIIEVGTGDNLTENARSRARVSLLSNVERDRMIVFAPKDGNVKHTVTVFTDVDCGYCRQLHREIDQINALGIEVHYLFYPRMGPNTESWEKADKVWCAANRNTALTRAKLGGNIPSDGDCGDTPVEGHYALGKAVGVRGTPALFSESGVFLGGYYPAKDLLEVLDEGRSSDASAASSAIEQ
jgi:thiol:disulfide interchange protein DsbC